MSPPGPIDAARRARRALAGLGSRARAHEVATPPAARVRTPPPPHAGPARAARLARATGPDAPRVGAASAPGARARAVAPPAAAVRLGAWHAPPTAPVGARGGGTALVAPRPGMVRPVLAAHAHALTATAPAPGPARAVPPPARPAMAAVPRAARERLETMRRAPLPWAALGRDRLRRAWDAVVRANGGGEGLELHGVYAPVPLGAVVGVALDADRSARVRVDARRPAGPVGALALGRAGEAGPPVAAAIPATAGGSGGPALG